MATWRCAECESSEHMEAIAYGYVVGPLADDGDLLSYDVVEDFGIEKDTVRCLEHPDAAVEKRVDGEWCRYQRCEWREGDYHCEYGRKMFYSRHVGSCPECNGTGNVFVPVASVATHETRKRG